MNLSLSRRARVSGPCRTAVLAGVLGITVLLGLATGSALASPPMVSVFAGDGTSGPAVAGPALDTPLNDLEGVAVDAAGNVYVPDNDGGHVDRITPDGTLSVIAGNGVGQPVPGPALDSPLGHIYSLTADPAGNVFITDWSYYLVMKISTDGMLSIVAGDGTYGPTLPGSPTGTSGGGGYAVGADGAGDVFFTNDWDNTLWKVTPDGILSKIAGNGSYGMLVAGPAVDSPMGFVYGNIAVDDAGTVYFGDGSYSIVAKVTPDGMLSIIAGTGVRGAPTLGQATSSQLNVPNGVAVDPAGNVYIADTGALMIERVTPDGTLSIFAGTGSFQYGQTATGAPTTVPIYPHSIAVDSAGNLVFTSGFDQLLRAGPAEPSAPRNVTAPAADGSATLSFDPPVSPGTTLVSGYEVSVDGGVTWRSLATVAGSGGRLTATLGGLVNGTTYHVLVRALNVSGAGGPSLSLAVTPVAPLGPVVVTPDPIDPGPPVAPVAPIAPVLVAPKLTAPTLPFLVTVRVHLPASCSKRCVITRATLMLRGGKTILGTRRNLVVTRHGWVRFTIPISKAVLISAPGQHAKPGWRTTLTHLTVAVRGASSDDSTLTRDGHLTINLTRLKSGGLPTLAELL